MIDRLFSDKERNWSFIHAAAAYTLVLFFMFRPVNFYLLDKVYSSYYMILIPVLVGMYYFTRGLRDGLEIKILTAYSLWIFVSRVINGQLFLELDRDLVFESFLTCVLVGLGLGLKPSFRAKLLDILSLTVTIPYTAICAISVYAGVFQKYLVNPITGATLVGYGEGHARINILDLNPCNGANWLYVSFCLLIYLFLRYKKWFYRIPILISLLLHHLCITLAFTRSINVSACVMVGLLAAMLVFEYKKGMTVRKKALTLVVIVCVISPLFYKSYDVSAKLLSKLHSISSVQTTEVAELSSRSDVKWSAEPLSYVGTVEVKPLVKSSIPADSEESAKQVFLSSYERDIGFKDTGRLIIWKTAFNTMINEPQRLIKGSLTRDIVEITGSNPEIRATKGFYGHFHNSYIETLVVGGLPGFALAMAFFLLLVIKSVKLFFAPAGSVSLAMRFLCLPVCSIMIYNLFESSLFAIMDFRSVSFFIIAGFMLAAAKDLPKIKN